MNEEAQIHELMETSFTLPRGAARSDLVKQAVRLADVLRDPDLQFETRRSYLGETCFTGQTAELLVTFTWLINHLKDYPPEREHEIMWEYKWVVNAAISFPEFKQDQIDFFIKDSHERYMRLGYSLRPLHFIEISLDIQRGDFSTARKLIETADKERRDSKADCHACELGSLSEYWFRIGEKERAVELVEMMIKTRKHCAEQPAVGLARASYFYADLGRWDEARDSYRQSYPKLARTESMSTLTWYPLLHRLRAGELKEALLVFDKHLPTFLKTRKKDAKFEFFLAARHLSKQLLENRSSIKLKSAAKLPLGQVADSIDIVELIAWLNRELEEIATAFDTRNNATIFTTRLHKEFPWEPPF